MFYATMTKQRKKNVSKGIIKSTCREWGGAQAATAAHAQRERHGSGRCHWALGWKMETAL